MKGKPIVPALRGWKEDSATNVVGLPTSCPAQQKLRRQGVSRPEHVGSHPTWNQEVVDKLTAARKELQGTDLKLDSPEYNEKAKSLLEGVEEQLRQSLGKMDRVTLDDSRVGANVPV